MTEKVTKLALTSRLILLVLQCLANILMRDHQTDAFRAVIDDNSSSNSQLKFRLLDKLLSASFSGLRHWDGEYFLHIAEHGYTYENTLAFYPLYPIIIGTTGRILHYIMGDFLNLRTCCLVMAIGTNILLFIKAANLLYQLTQRIFNDICKSWHAALLFCFNPASIFFTAAYSETLFTVVTLYIMFECFANVRLVCTSLMMSLSLLSRSNGLLNIGFPVYYLLRRVIHPYGKQTILNITKLFLIIIASIIPLTIYNFYTYQLYCNPLNSNNSFNNYSEAIIKYGRAKNFVIAGIHDLGATPTPQQEQQQSPWCNATLPFPYTYVQSHYWQVGFFRYYELKQLPNFLLALPILIFLLSHCLSYLKYFFLHCYWVMFNYQRPQINETYPPSHQLRQHLSFQHYYRCYFTLLSQILREYKILPFVVHALVLTIICICFAHIQISTRLLCSGTPCLYWFCADYLPKTLDKLRLYSYASLILIWFITYYLIGCILFSNNLPWT